jgi:uncharacterized membrane protein YdbT with pleckstrin-like domain
MFCSKCGTTNSDDANFCQKCGLRFDGEEETKVEVSAKRLSVAESETTEREIFSIRPTLLFVQLGYAAAVLGGFLLVVILYLIDSQFESLSFPWWFSVISGLALLLIPAFYHLKQKTVRYTLTDSKIEIDEGFIFQNSRSVPLRSIQDVSVSSTIFQRLLGFGNLLIDNASDDGTKIVLKNINTPKKYSDQLLKEMRLLSK